jgi:DNA-binding HxlR family transcriptional regulator
MSRHAELAIDDCPIARTSALIARKWVIVIIRDLADSPRRFSELEAWLHVNPRTLSERLSCLADEGIIDRTSEAGSASRVAYALTPKGLALVPVLEAMRTFGTAWL